jgi:hypothetical protein
VQPDILEAELLWGLSKLRCNAMQYIGGEEFAEEFRLEMKMLRAARFFLEATPFQIEGFNYG